MRSEVDTRAKLPKDKPVVSSVPMTGTYTFTTFESEARGDNGYDDMTSRGWTLHSKTSVVAGYRYMWVRPGTPSLAEHLDEFVMG